MKGLGAAIVGLSLLIWPQAALAAIDDPLLNAIDLSRPELADVREAYDQGNAAAARKAFADYLRKRATPKWKIDPDHPPQELSDDYRQQANDALHHKIYSMANPSYPYQFGDRIDWSFDPTSLPTSPIAQTREWTWAANRHYTWVALAQAYTVMGDAKYGLEFSKELKAWVQDNPPADPRHQDIAGSRWRGIEAGIRMSATWPEVYYRLIHHPDALPDDGLLTMVESMRQHAEMLDVATTKGRGNHLAVAVDGLYCVGAFFPEFKNAEKWRTDAAHRQREQITAQVYPDGAQMELAPEYHMFAQDSFTGILELAQWNHYPLPEGYRENMERMYAANMWEMSPDRRCPPFNDSDAEDIIKPLEQGLSQFPRRDDWAWIVSDGKRGHPPIEASHLFEYAGWPVMRSGWERDARYLLMECGPFGMGHQHEDKLSFVLHAYGSSLVSEGGIYTYDASEMRKYVLTARAHNVIHIDDLEQNRRGGPAEFNITTKPIEMNWHSTPEYDYAQGSFGELPNERWGPGRVRGFVHTRRVLFIKPDFWVILDTVVPPKNDSGEHKYDSTFHLVGTNVSVDARTNSVRTNNSGANLSIIPLNRDGLSVRVITGQKEPFYQGWIGQADSELIEVPSATPYFTLHCAGPARFLYVFSPSKPGEPGPVKGVTETKVANAEISADIALADGKQDEVALLNDGAVIYKRAKDDSIPLRIEPVGAGGDSKTEKD